MTSSEIRQKFLDFFKEKGHTVLPSASLMPENDSSVLFTTAGMQQFKHYYSRPDEAPAVRIATAQKCVRTGDIDEVGDKTHLTFFEMLGNFSFGYPTKEGSYFKKEAIEMAWEFLTQVLKIDINRISATYFNPSSVIPSPSTSLRAGSESRDLLLGDDESYQLLKKITGFSDEKIKGTGKDETFWGPTGNEGPCGPTVEFYIDGIEIWNLVFNQYYCKDGQYTPLKYQGVDTGMGFERLLTVLNGVDSVYETDLFKVIIKKIEEVSGKRYDDFITEFRIIADHIKAATFLINDGVVPSNKDRGYVLRRLIRRAIVKAHQLGITSNFTADLAKVVFGVYNSSVYFGGVIPAPDRVGGKHPARIQDSGSPIRACPVLDTGTGMTREKIPGELKTEEVKFRQTLKRGIDQISAIELAIKKNIGPAGFRVSGKDLFNLYQSYGFPLELSIEEFSRRDLQIDPDEIENYRIELRKHQELSRTAAVGMFKGGLVGNDEDVIKNHTAAHLLLAALRRVLGDHVIQKGSNITAERLRFDFSHPQKMAPEQIKAVEDLVNEQIQKDLPVVCEEMTLEEAKKSDAMGVFDAKYGDRVKVYTIGRVPSLSERGLSPEGTVPRPEEYFSREICGGPHVSRTGELGHFKITKEEASSAGVRRIKAMLE
ncbi:MAG: alanine--tRNA ligase-related protein [Patescibacteria group bacterium]